MLIFQLCQQNAFSKIDILFNFKSNLATLKNLSGEKAFSLDYLKNTYHGYCKSWMLRITIATTNSQYVWKKIHYISDVASALVWKKHIKILKF